MSELQSKAKSIALLSPAVTRWNVVFLLTAVLVATVDQVSKSWVRTYAEGTVILRAGFFQIVHGRNSGAAFGMFQDYSAILTGVAVAAILSLLAFGLLFWHRLGVFTGGTGKLALGLVLGGTAGNLIDRLRFGNVTDFIDVRFWPSFNVADSAISIGVILFVYSMVFLREGQKP
ncbi:MAG: signal peptidase II [Chloroflexi bacterium]|nr:signal peptidase II [Chloroflexota bacterium]